MQNKKLHKLNNCKGIDGELSENNRNLLQKMMQGGSQEVWLRAQKVIIVPVPLTTLGMAVKRVSQDKNFPGSFPDPFTAHRAMEYALKRGAAFRKNPQAFDIET